MGNRFAELTMALVSSTKDAKIEIQSLIAKHYMLDKKKSTFSSFFFIFGFLVLVFVWFWCVGSSPSLVFVGFLFFSFLFFKVNCHFPENDS